MTRARKEKSTTRGARRFSIAGGESGLHENSTRFLLTIAGGHAMLGAMVEVICFSKDRSLQLDAYLRSLRGQARFDFRRNVLYTVSTPAFAAAYHQLRGRHGWVRWIREELSCILACRYQLSMSAK